MPASAGDRRQADSTLKIDKVTVEALDFDRMKEQQRRDLPRFAKMKLEGVTGDEDMSATSLDPYGMPAGAGRRGARLPARRRRQGVHAQHARDQPARPGHGRAVAGDRRRQREGERDGRRQGRRPAAQRLAHASTTRACMPSCCRRSPRSRARTPEGLVALALLSIAAFCAGQGTRDREGARLRWPPSSATGRAPKGPLVIGLTPAKARELRRPRQGHGAQRPGRHFGLRASYPAPATAPQGGPDRQIRPNHGVATQFGS